MAKKDNLKDFLTDVADAIRAKKGTTDLINPQDFVAEIRSIAGLPRVDKVTHNELDAFLLDLANTLREAKGTSEPINPQAFSAQILSIAPVTTDMKLLPLFVEAIEPLTVSFSVNPIEYSLDNNTWQTLPVDASTPTIDAGKRVYFRASGLTATSANGIGTFSTTGMFNVGGNIMSMAYSKDFKDKTDIINNYAFSRLFVRATGLIDASNLQLPAISLSDSCYKTMFGACVNLAIAPTHLPALILSKRCYNNMYYECSNLEIGSDLPATDLTNMTYCYNNMYYGCSKLRYLKAMILTPSPNNDNYYGAQTGNWLKGVAYSGVFVKNSKATWSVRGDHGIPTGWTIKLADE